MIEAHATARYVRTSAQKAGLVMDLIRGAAVNEALATLRFARKSVAHDIEKVLRSAIANAQQKEGFGGDVERLVVSACYANQGPSMKRVRPAPMGRAFRIQKRTAHLTVHVIEQAPAQAKKAGTSTRRRAAARSKTRTGAGAGRAAKPSRSTGRKKMEATTFSGASQE